jgi:hypothetical protein
LARSTSSAGNAFASIALAFAVLELTGSKTDLGLVLAARSIPQIVFLLAGGIWADRLPRHRLMVVSNLVSGASQAVVAALLLSGRAQIWELVVFASVNGTSSSFFFPASQGIVPQVVPAPILQQANALLRLGLNATTIGGAALGGLIVSATSPGVGMACDAASFLLAAAFTAGMRVPAGLRLERSNFLSDLVAGWREFSSRKWLWVIVVQFALFNATEQGSENVLGPVVAKAHLSGAAGWGLVLTAEGLGFFAAGLLMLRLRPVRMLRVATLACFLTVPFPIALAIPLPLAAVVAAAFVAGAGVEVFGVLWETALQQEIPREKLSRVSSYDALGSWVLMPVGLALAGPTAQAFGIRATLVGAALVAFVTTGAALSVADVRDLRRMPTTQAS